MAIIIDGKKTAQKIFDKIKQEVKQSKKTPSLAVILAGDDNSSKIYVSSKEKKSKELGFKSAIYRYDKTVSQKEIEDLIKKLNNDKNTNAILVQLPLYSHLNTQKIIELIDPKKDVDGFNPLNIGKLMCGIEPYAVCCTPKGILKLLKEYNIELKGKHAVIIGRSNIVGKPLSYLLLNNDMTVTITHSKTKNLKEITKQADLLISAAGVKKLVTQDMVKNGAVVIDVGISRDNKEKITGDVDFENVKNTASCITPTPGGVGPMTIACLMENTWELFQKQEGIK